MLVCAAATDRSYLY